ncbi:hypothetical protein COHA_002140 [Chlorella ohadii]|uniref:Transmembrane protein n=1 Tax=Chlorella ohadii TaxID=2649997 RepID=A0AAD5H8Z3_9CHLO|nr:hypothetical protein COHA_002140 [Chlorella ohadii]
MAEYHRRTPAEQAAHRRGNMIATAVVALALVTLAMAIATLVILTVHLMPSDECLFTTASQSVNVCQLSRGRTYGLAVCIISFLCSIIMVFALCHPPVAIGAVSALAPCGGLVYNRTASDAGLPNQSDRTSVIGLSWACFAGMLLIFGLASHLYRAKWEPEEIGRGPADEFDRFVQFKARQEAVAKPPSAV